MTDASPTSAVTYIMPIRSAVSVAGGELDAYLEWLSTRAEVLVVDGSAAEVFAQHAAAWARFTTHVAPAADLVTPMGKVGGVLTGVRCASHERLVIADDDVRYDADALGRVVDALDRAEVVRPQNYFDPLPWHARWDSARTLLNRASGGDWPGTLGVRRSLLQRTGGYDGRAMFENLELVRTVIAAGGREALLLDAFVARRPSTSHHFWSQRVRQAYDELARPRRLVVQLAVLPLTVLAGASIGWPAIAAGVLTLFCIAEFGRRRAGGTHVFPASTVLFAPVWVAERAVCSWLAVASRVVYGGVRYRGRVLHHAATPMRVLRARHASPATASHAETTGPRPTAPRQSA
jgi:hypothetical protein